MQVQGNLQGDHPRGASTASHFFRPSWYFLPHDFQTDGAPPIILPQDELRIASISDPAEGHSVAYWKHLACMTPTVVSSQVRPTSSTSRPLFPPFQTRYHD